jgi:hypothetical protein
MARHPWSTLFLVTGLLACTRGPAYDPVAVAPEVRQARTVFLGDFGRSADGDAARALLRTTLTDAARFVVVDDELTADAVLNGSVTVRRASGRLQDARVYGTLHLTSRHTGHLLWRHEYVERSMQTLMNQPTPQDLLKRFARQMSAELHGVAAAGTAVR